jgi:hypothetical protein
MRSWCDLFGWNGMSLHGTTDEFRRMPVGQMYTCTQRI